MSNPSDIINLDHFNVETIDPWLNTADILKKCTLNKTGHFKGDILCPIFMQESSRTYINATSSFMRLGGNILPLNMMNTRFGSTWAEPVQDFGTLINACVDYVIFRSERNGELYEFRDWCDLPIINAGNGSGSGSEHPMQALVDLFTIKNIFGKKTLRILMVGGEHIRTTRSQIKLFLKYQHKITILSPESPVCNGDIEELYKKYCHREYDINDVDLSLYDVIYHNGMDEDSNAVPTKEFKITKYLLDKCKFEGKIMHSLPRKNELSSNVDDTKYNIYFKQMELSKYIYQSMYMYQKYGLLNKLDIQRM